MGEGIGDRFQRETKYIRARPRASRAGPMTEAGRQPSAAGPPIRLDSSATAGGMTLWEALARRRSVRTFREVPLSFAALSQLVWAAQGVTCRASGYEFRTAPSAGALYPVETYIAAHSVEGLRSGIYHHDVPGRALALVTAGDFREAVAEAALGQEFTASAAAVFIWTAVFARSKVKYRERAYRYVYLDAGHIAQNLALAAVALGLGSCQIAALFDDEANDLVGADGIEESVIYMSAVGYPSSGKESER